MPADPTELMPDGAIAWPKAADDRPAATSTRRTAAIGQPLTGPADPRWVLALRTAESMEGQILRPEKRERVLRVGGMLGLSAFDSNLVIAIVQDQARRGYAPVQCPAAGENQLTMIPLPDAHLPRSQQSRKRRIHWTLTVATVIATLLVAEAFLIWRFFL